ncbi:L-threonylcarbamoyladenylate synthase [Spongisporangium articulatum]|uniref:L-threonylcarbamoyladenylate synthase n=1 Tax=Spongisporangium articulatum TaxID=3362603 RepID=A0ABW8AUW8_9ACTN
MSRYFDVTDLGERAQGISVAADHVGAGSCVVVPTDTVYAIACDAFSPQGLQGLQAAKGLSRLVNPQVLVPHVRTLDGLATAVGPDARALAEAFWPGALTIICRAQPTLNWELGAADGTVAVRMPLHPVALQLLERTGPLAVSGANLTGAPAATTCGEAQLQLADAVEVYLDGGPSTGGVPSSVVDTTGPTVRLLRAGAIDAEGLRAVVPDLLVPGQMPDEVPAP